MLNPVKILFHTFKDKSSCFSDRKDHRQHQPLHNTEDTANGVEELRHLATVTSDSHTEMRTEGKFCLFLFFYRSSTHTSFHKLILRGGRSGPKIHSLFLHNILTVLLFSILNFQFSQF